MSELLTPEQIQSDKQLLREILNNGEYNTPAKKASWLEKLWDGLLDFLGRILPDHAVPHSLADALSYLFILVITGLLVYLLVWLARRYSRDWQLSRAVTLSDAELGLSYRDYLSQAEAAGVNKNYSEGVRCCFLALLFYADANGWLKAEKWKANGEYALELGRGKAALKPLFVEVSRLFDQIYYGKQSAGQPVYEDLLLRVSSVIAEGVDYRG